MSPKGLRCPKRTDKFRGIILRAPIIAINDIVIYNANTHEITLTANAFNRISGLEVPVTGKSFVVCVDKNPIYCGAFWTPIRGNIEIPVGKRYSQDEISQIQARACISD